MRSGAFALSLNASRSPAASLCWLSKVSMLAAEAGLAADNVFEIGVGGLSAMTGGGTSAQYGQSGMRARAQTVTTTALKRLTHRIGTVSL